MVSVPIPPERDRRPSAAVAEEACINEGVSVADHRAWPAAQVQATRPPGPGVSRGPVCYTRSDDAQPKAAWDSHTDPWRGGAG
jgi:hypothetical protein